MTDIFLYICGKLNLKYYKMKKLLVAAAAGLFVLTSCVKDYTCECTYTYDNVSTTSSTTLTGKKKDVETACKNGSSTYTVCTVK